MLIVKLFYAIRKSIKIFTKKKSIKILEDKGGNCNLLTF